MYKYTLVICHALLEDLIVHIMTTVFLRVILFQTLGPLDVAADIRQHTSAITDHLMRNNAMRPPQHSNDSTTQIT